MERAIFFSFGFSCSPHGYPAKKADLAGFSQMLDRAEVASLQGRTILVLPLLAIAERWVFGFGKIRLEYNTVEHVFVQAYIACQILLLIIMVLPFNERAQVDDYYELPWWLIFVLLGLQAAVSLFLVGKFLACLLLSVICLLILLLLAVLVFAFGIYLLALDVG